MVFRIEMYPWKKSSVKTDQITIAIHLNQGKYTDRMLTCDLTYDYIRINADYRT